MRNFDDWLKFKSFVQAITLLAVLQLEVSFGQPPRVALNPQNNAAAQPAAKPNAAAQPVDQFQELLDRAIDFTSKRYLVANAHSPWQIFHCILALRQDSLLKLGKEKVNAINWLSTAEPQFDNEPWMLLTPHGAKFHPYTKMWFFEGHPSQFLALLTHSNLPLDYQFHVQGKVVTLNDFINNTMKEVNTKEEVTWVLWTLQHYLSPDAEWTNQANEAWSIERLVQIESAAPVVGAPCGGNHRLFALTRARDKYLKTGKPLRGVWLVADQKIKQHIELAKSLQNTDGSFSADSYKGPMHTNDLNQRFNTTGHTMEFLSIALPDHRLHEPWVRNAVWMLSRELIINRDNQIDAGPLFHTLDSLILYRERIRGKTPKADAPQVAVKVPALSSGINLKTKPDPVTVTQPQTATPEPQPENKPENPNPSSLKPEESSVRPMPEDKSVEPSPAKAIEAQSKSTKIEFKKARTSLASQEIPKIDPSKLSNVGQAAPASVATKANLTRSQLRNVAPGLLPDIDATPLSNLELPGSKLLPESIAMKTDKKISDSSNISDEDLSNLIPPVIESSLNDDEPVSAMTPENVRLTHSNEDS